MITHGFTKKTEKIPANKIKHAKVFKKNLRRIIMTNVKFDDYLNDELQELNVDVIPV